MDPVSKDPNGPVNDALNVSAHAPASGINILLSETITTRRICDTAQFFSEAYALQIMPKATRIAEQAASYLRQLSGKELEGVGFTLQLLAVELMSNLFLYDVVGFASGKEAEAFKQGGPETDRFQKALDRLIGSPDSAAHHRKAHLNIVVSESGVVFETFNTQGFEALEQNLEQARRLSSAAGAAGAANIGGSQAMGQGTKICINVCERIERDPNDRRVIRYIVPLSKLG